MDLNKLLINSIVVSFTYLWSYKSPHINKYGISPIVALNKFEFDTEKEVELLKRLRLENGSKLIVTEVFAKGGEGAIDLATEVIKNLDNNENHFHYLYDEKLSIKEKIEIVSKEIYGAEGVIYSEKAEESIKKIESIGRDKLPICIAKTQYSLSDDPKLLGRPEKFNITIREILLKNGAEFIVAIAGNIMTMPGLPKIPAAEAIHIAEDGETILGLF